MADELFKAAQAVIDSAERSGSRICFGSGDEPDTWIEYKEVPTSVLNHLEAVLTGKVMCPGRLCNEPGRHHPACTLNPAYRPGDATE
jgi:hypothetical protein